jgi:DNA primase
MARNLRSAAERRPRWPIEDILDRTDLARLLDEVAEPAASARGRRWRCPVPGHDDRNPSVSMRVDQRGHERWRCWSGDDTHRGDAIDLVQLTQRLERGEAIDWLARRAGLSPEHPTPTARRRRPATPRQPTYVPLHPDVTRYVHACERILDTPTGRPIREWLARRGIGRDVAVANHVGADPGRHLLPRPKGLPFGAGGDRHPQPAATFPALDQAGNVRYVQARYLDPAAAGIKYDNPSLARGSNPRLTWTVPVGERRPGILIVTEGIPDALTAAQAGYHAVGILGSQAPDPTVATRIATRAANDDLTIVAIADADPAGRQWARRLTDHLHDLGHEPIALEPAVGTDLNDWSLADRSWAHTIADATRTARDAPGIEGKPMQAPDL